MLALGWAGSLFAKAPSWDGGMVRPPVRNRRYSSPISALPTRLLARSFSVRVFCTLYISRIWRWSWRPSRHARERVEDRDSVRLQAAGAGSDAGELEEAAIRWPVVSTTSRRAATRAVEPSPRRTSTPVARGGGGAGAAGLARCRRRAR